MEGYDASTYGDRFADVYDDWYGDVTDVGSCTQRLAALAGDGPVLELGVGSGRLALPLAKLGVEVHGIDASEAMLARLLAKPGGDAIQVTCGDMAELALPDPPAFAVVFAAFNTLFNLGSVEAQQRCLDRAASLLAADGLLVIEAFVPPEVGDSGPPGTVTPRHLTVDEVVLSVSQHREGEQTITGQHIHITEQGIRLRPWHLRYARPSELDAMAAAAGLSLAWRHADWVETPFGPDAGVHVSAYHRGIVRTVLPPLRMSQLRLNPLTGRWVTVAAERASRPGELISRQLPVEADPSRKCPFCPGNEEATPPALETYGPGGTWLVRVVPNLFPAFEGGEPLRVQNLGPVYTQASASGVHEVLVFSPVHTDTWADLDDKHAGLAMAAIRDRMEDHARRTMVRYTQAIVNAGREAGASLDHPHGQILGIPFVPGEIAEEEAGFRRFGESCLLCTMAEAERQSEHRIVIDDEKVLVVCPYWSGAPYEMLVMPRNHEVHLENTSPSDVVAVGRAIRDALALLRSRVGDAAYNLVFHTAPHHHDGPFHWHVHIVPRLTSLAGFEQGTGVMINIVAPELAARHLKG